MSAFAAAGGAALAALAAPALAAADDVVLISRATGPAGAPVDADAIAASISADGSVVAFATDADNLSAEDGAARDIFVRDTATNVTTFVSRATGVSGSSGDGNSIDPSISGNGRFVAFESDADNLSAEDDDGFTNIFVRDLAAGTTTLVSRAPGPAGAGADAESGNPDISADGRFVAFESDADNLSPDDDDTVRNIFVRDLVAGTTTLVSRAPGPGGAGADGNSHDPAISADGNRVAFESLADNLSDEDDDTPANVFVRDLAAASLTFASRATGAAGAPADASSVDADISPSGRYVAFESSADNLSPDDNDSFNVFLRDLDDSTTALMSRASGAGGAGADDFSFSPVVSDNARVAFYSNANNLSPTDDDGFGNVFVRDALADTTELVSRGEGAGAAANRDSLRPTISQDGRHVAFQSMATNLVAGTIPGVRNVYRRDTLDEPVLAPAGTPAALTGTPACKALPAAPSPAARSGAAAFTLSAAQLLINQRIGQAAIRRLNAVEARLDGGLRPATCAAIRSARAGWGPGSAAAPRGPRWRRSPRPTRPRSRTRAAEAAGTDRPSAPASC